METARRYLGNDITNNVAEYEGLTACMHRALQVVPRGGFVLFEVDSKLICRQVQVLGPGKFACRTDQLKPHFLERLRLEWALQDANVTWVIRHIVREFNQTADTLSNQAIDLGNAAWAAA